MCVAQDASDVGRKPTERNDETPPNERLALAHFSDARSFGAATPPRQRIRGLVSARRPRNLQRHELRAWIFSLG